MIGLAGSKKAEISEFKRDSANNRCGGAEHRQTDRRQRESEREGERVSEREGLNIHLNSNLVFFSFF